MTEVAGQKRTYRSPVRAERAAQTRRSIIAAAAELFSTHGFGGTTMGDIARVAGVSVESVHATGTKPALLLEAFRTRYAGEGGWTAFRDVQPVKEIMAGTDPERAVVQISDFLAAGHAASARLMIELRAAAGVEPMIAEQWDELVALKHDGWLASAEWLVRIGVVEADVAPEDIDRLAAGLNVVGSAETYLQLADDWGLDDDQYRAWLIREMRLATP